MSLLVEDTALPPPPARIARFSVDQYHRMIASGALREDDRLELLEGWVVEKMSKNPPHSFVTQLLEERIRSLLPTGWHVRNQEPITLANSEPEPDLAIVRGERSDYARRHPGPEDVALLIEVADASLPEDRWKCAIYAGAEIPAYWIVNLRERCIETFGEPDSLLSVPTYRQEEPIGEDGSVSLTVDGIERGTIDVGDVIPPDLYD